MMNLQKYAVSPTFFLVGKMTSSWNEHNIDI